MSLHNLNESTTMCGANSDDASLALRLLTHGSLGTIKRSAARPAAGALPVEADTSSHPAAESIRRYKLVIDRDAIDLARPDSPLIGPSRD